MSAARTGPLAPSRPRTSSRNASSRVAGGAPGATGRNYVLRSDGRIDAIPHVGKTEMGSGDVFVIETPGGGGFGASK